MGCVSSRADDIDWGEGPLNESSPISQRSHTTKIHVCRMGSSYSVSRRSSDGHSAKSRTAMSGKYARNRLDSLNASSSTVASSSRGKFRYQRERRYVDV